MFIDPPRRAVVPGSTNNNRDYFILSFLWGLILICMVVLVSVITIPYYYHYKVIDVTRRCGPSSSPAHCILSPSFLPSHHSSSCTILRDPNSPLTSI